MVPPNPKALKLNPRSSGPTCDICAWWHRERYGAPVRGEPDRLAHAVSTELGRCGRLRLLNLTVLPATGSHVTDMQPSPTTPADFACNRWEPK